MQQYFLNIFDRKERERIILNQIFIIRWCAKKHIPIIILEYEGYEKTINILTEELKKAKSLEPIEKSCDDGFFDTELDNVLKKIGAKNIFFMGTNAHYCVKATAQEAIKRGYKIITSYDVIIEYKSNSIFWYEKNGTVIPSMSLLEQQ